MSTPPTSLRIAAATMATAGLAAAVALAACIDFAAPPPPADAVVGDLAEDARCGVGEVGAGCALCDAAGRWGGCPVGCDADGACLPATALGAGRRQVCALAGGRARCWTDGAAPWPTAAPLALPGEAPIDALATGADHVCLLAAGDVYCAGANDAGQCGAAPSELLAAPVRVALPAAAIAVFGGAGDTTCARLAGGAVWCWGATLDGQDALAEGAATSGPTEVAAGGDAAPDVIAIGGSHACWLVGGAVACWGDNSHGQLGTGDGEDHPEPTPVPTLSEGVVALAAGRDHSCALTDTNALLCWGLNTSAQSGQASTHASLVEPVKKAMSTATALTALALGERHSLVLDESGIIRCFGANELIECGSAASSGRFVKTVGGLPAASAVAGGWRFGCALDRAGLVWCWGASPDLHTPGGASAHLVVAP